MKPSPAPSDPTKPWTYDGNAVVADIYPSGIDEECFTDLGAHLGEGIFPDTMIDLDLADGTKVTVGLGVPGYVQGSIAKGDAVAFKYSVNVGNFAAITGLLQLQKAGKTIVAIGQNAPPSIPIAEGDAECYSEDSLCGHKDVAVKVDSQTGPVQIENGKSEQAGSLLVTNDHYFYNYDTSGACNFGMSVEYLMSIAATQ